MELEAGVVVAERYRIQRQLGRGGMGEVFAAENIRTGRVVAVKVLRADTKQKSSAVARFQREARAAGAINSDHVTQVLDVDDDPEHGIVIVFELLEGESLIERLKRTGPMSFDELHPIVEQVWMGLNDAHKAGIIHRDLKPSNVFLERRPDGSSRVKILDFGISKLPREVGGETLTEMGQSLGTFSFMPPEQIGKAKTVDHRADIYAAATLIFQALSGQLPYAAKNILQMVDLKTKSEPRLISTVLDHQVDPRLDAFLARCLARSPEDRFATVEDALAAWKSLKRAAVLHHDRPGVDRSEARTEARPGPVFAGAAAHPTHSGDPPAVPVPSARLAATAIIADPHAAGSSPHAPQQRQYAPQQHGHGAASARGLGGTVALPQQAALPQQSQQQQQTRQSQQSQQGSLQQPSGRSQPGFPRVPVMSSDTTSESGTDQAATVALPMRVVKQAIAAQAGLPRLHDDHEKGGTQLMNHALARKAPMTPTPAAGAPMQRQVQQVRQAQPISQVSPLRSSGSHQLPSTDPLRSSSGNHHAQPGAGDEGLTTVYRRERSNTSGPQTQAEVPSSSRAGMLLGIVAFALVGFALAAVVLHYVQTGRMLWQ